MNRLGEKESKMLKYIEQVMTVLYWGLCNGVTDMIIFDCPLRVLSITEVLACPRSGPVSFPSTLEENENFRMHAKS